MLFIDKIHLNKLYLSTITRFTLVVECYFIFVFQHQREIYVYIPVTLQVL